MAGICKYCGFSGTNDEMADHAGECPVMLQDHQPEDPKLIDRMYNFWFISKYGFPNGMCILIVILLLGAGINLISYYMKFTFIQYLIVLIQPVLLLILTIYTITLVYLKHRLDNK
jgi:hypothetical protein